MNSTDYDIAIIGGGPGGYVAAIRAAQLGKKTLLIEKDNLGGVCLNWGCIPTKALLKSSEILRYIKKSNEFGIDVQGFKPDIKKMVQRSRKISETLTKGIKSLVKKNKIDVEYGHAKISKNKSIIINDKKEITSSNIIIATGSKARTIKGFEPDDQLVWTYMEALVPEKIPNKLIIVGSGAIGIEFASFYNELGTEVTVIEAEDRILMKEDREISEALKRNLEAQDIKFLLSSKLETIKKLNNKVKIEVTSKNGKKELEGDHILMAIGITPNSSEIGIENTEIKLDRGFIKTGPDMKASENIYAIGDVTGGACLAHKASHEAIIAVENICGLHAHKLKQENIPSCVYSYPQVASIGHTEDELKNMGKKIKTGIFPAIANGKSLAIGSGEGFIKAIFDDDTGEILGVHMIGPEVTELISGVAIAKAAEATDLELVNTIFPHPTLSEMLHESVLSALKRPIHI